LYAPAASPLTTYVPPGPAAAKPSGPLPRAGTTLMQAPGSARGGDPPLITPAMDPPAASRALTPVTAWPSATRTVRPSTWLARFGPAGSGLPRSHICTSSR
jgi:hypothetical protein